MTRGNRGLLSAVPWLAWFLCFFPLKRLGDGCHPLEVQPSEKRHDNGKDNRLKIIYPGIPTTIKTMGVNITTIAYLRVLIIEIGSTIILMLVEAQGISYQIW